MIVGSIKENITLEKRVSVTPESAKNIIGLGLKLCIEKGYASFILEFMMMNTKKLELK